MYYYQSEDGSSVTLPVNIMRHQHPLFGTAAAGPGGRMVSFAHHNHNILEILLITEGALFVSVSQKEYLLRAGDVLIINPYEIHAGDWLDSVPNSAYLCLTINLRRLFAFEKSVLQQVSNELLNESCRFDTLLAARKEPAENAADAGAQEDARQPASLIAALARAFSDKSAQNECRTLACVYELFSQLLDGHYHEVPDSASFRRDLDFIKKVARYLDLNYEKEISTARISEELFMSMSQFCHKFRRHFGCSFSNYLCKYRVIRAAERFRDSQLSVADIAAAVGFKDYCYFSRSFKKYIGQTPAVFFQRWQR